MSNAGPGNLLKKYSQRALTSKLKIRVSVDILEDNGRVAAVVLREMLRQANQLIKVKVAEICGSFA
jgi:hypothetical protein